jgi:hypothetical protein
MRGWQAAGLLALILAGSLAGASLVQAAIPVGPVGEAGRGGRGIDPMPFPTVRPSPFPTSYPTAQPTAFPTVQPTAFPTFRPSTSPSPAVDGAGTGDGTVSPSDDDVYSSIAAALTRDDIFYGLPLVKKHRAFESPE